MKVILLEDVKTLGKAGDVVEVSTGYARNKILHQNLGIEATPKNLNDRKLQAIHQKKIEEKNLELAKEYGAKVEQVTVELTLKVGEGGKTFGSVSSKEIAVAAKKQHNLTIDKKKLVLSEPIRSLGVTEVPLKIHSEVTATLKVHVGEAK